MTDKMLHKTFQENADNKIDISRAIKKMLFITSVSAVALSIAGCESANFGPGYYKLREVFTGESLVGSDGKTELIRATERGSIQDVRRLWAEGANVNFAVEGGLTPLMVASARNLPEIVNFLLDKGANANATLKGKNMDGTTVLMWAITSAGLGKMEMSEVISLLVEKGGADVNAVDYRGYTALMWAASFGRGDIIEYLVIRGAKINIVDNSGKNALSYAIQHAQQGGSDRAMQILKALGSGAKPSGVVSTMAASNARGSTSAGGDINAATALKILYGNVELPQRGQRTPLTMLVEKNAGVSAELSRWRGTPLNMVAQQTVWHPKAVSTAYAVWHNIKPPKDWGAGKIDSQAVFAVHEWRYSEKGKEKYFLLTQTTDLKEPQTCFACLPIMGAAVFSKEGEKWALEAENKYVGMTGGYGVLGGDVGLAEVGPERHGIVHNLVITKYNCKGGVFDIIMPHQGSIGSFRVGEYEELCIQENGAAVGRIDALPSGFGFDRSASTGGYYEVTRKLRSQANPRAKVVTVTQRFRFTNGAYKSVKAASRKKK